MKLKYKISLGFFTIIYTFALGSLFILQNLRISFSDYEVIWEIANKLSIDQNYVILEDILLSVSDGEQNFQYAFTSLASFVALSTLICITLSFFLSKTITKSIDQMDEFANGVAGGNYLLDLLDVNRKD